MIVNAVVRTFAPEQWGELGVFVRFYSGTHVFSGDTRKALSGVGGHLHKAVLLRDLAIKMAPNLDIDREQLQARGFTPALNSREFSAVVEAILLDLYSSIDCSRKVLVSIYRRCRGLPDSTRKLFARVKSGKLGPDFPAPLKLAISEADWYEELLRIRDELTHSDVGSCHLDPNTKKISYTHHGINSQGSPLWIGDVMAKIEALIDGINSFLDKVFHFLNSQLRPYVADELCGIFFGRGYMRTIPLADKIDSDSGFCRSRQWFDSDSAFKCPLADSCGAYLRVAPAG